MESGMVLEMSIILRDNAAPPSSTIGINAKVWPYQLGCCNTWELDRMVSACIVWHVSLVNVLTLTAVRE